MTHSDARRSDGIDLSRLVVLAFALVQAVLVARILLDLGVIPADRGFGELVIGLSDVLAVPVQGVGSGLSSVFGGGGFGGIAGEGLNPVMLVALAGWSVVEGLVIARGPKARPGMSCTPRE